MEKKADGGGNRREGSGKETGKEEPGVRGD